VVFSSLIATRSASALTGNNSELAVKGELTEEKMKLVCFLICALVIAFVQQSLQDDEDTIPVVISRRLTGDIHYFDYPEKFSVCNDIDGSNVTYLVEERLCVTSNDLQKGKYQ
jgi:hypothetical protein